MLTNKQIGKRWIWTPIISLILILSVQAITSFTVSSLVQAGNQNVEIIGRIINVVLMFLGTLDVIFIIIGIVVGVSYLNKKEAKKEVSINKIYDERSGKGSKSEFPKELVGWNWGAAGLTWIWGAYNHVWISFLMFVPVVNFVFWIFLGMKGNQWAWEKNKWESAEAFKKAQNKWKPLGVTFFVFSVISVILYIFGRNN